MKFSRRYLFSVLYALPFVKQLAAKPKEPILRAGYRLGIKWTASPYQAPNRIDFITQKGWRVPVTLAPLTDWSSPLTDWSSVTSGTINIKIPPPPSAGWTIVNIGHEFPASSRRNS